MLSGNKNYNPTVLVTGAGRKGRVGEAIARAFHAQGYVVILHYNSSSTDADELANELNQKRPDSAHVVQGALDSKDLKKVAQTMIEEAYKFSGTLNVIVNSASRFEMSKAGEIDIEQLDRLMRLNAYAPLMLMQAFNQRLQSAGQTKGVVINISDVFARQPSPTHAAYNASKLTLEKFTGDGAATFSNLRVNALTPGAMLRPDGLDPAKDSFNGYEGTDCLITKIFETLADQTVNGKIVPAVKGMVAYPVDFKFG